MLFFLLINIKMPTIVGTVTPLFVVCCSCACLMRPPSEGTKPYQAHYLSMRCVFCAHIQFCPGLIRWTPPRIFSDTAITDHHSDTTFSSSEHTGCGYPSLLDRKNRSVVAAGGSRTLDFLRKRRTPYLLNQALCTFMSRKNSCSAELSIIFYNISFIGFI